MKKITKLIIAIFLVCQAHAIMAQDSDYDALEKFILKYGMKGIVMSKGGCSAQCCLPRVITYFFEDGNCVRQSFDQTEDRVTYFGKWQKHDSIITIHFTETCYGKGVGNDTYEDYYTCSGVLRYNLYSAVREKTDIHEVNSLNNTKEWLYNFDSFLENNDVAYSNRKKQKYIAEFASYNFFAIHLNEQQKRYGEFYLSSLNKQELKLLRNHIFAKYGQVFKDAELKNYFSLFSWYKPMYVDVTAYLTSCDKINIELIKKYETTAPHSSVPDAPDKVEKIPNIEMVFVKGSAFTMGCTTKDKEDRNCNYDENAHQEKVNDFYIGKYEITQAQWEAVMGNNPADEKGGDLPVAQVNWYDIQYFIQRLNKLTGKHYRLPTETEWEYACRGGENSEQYQYSGSNNADDVAWFYENRRNRTNPVGQKKPNELDIYDMNGNVDEICKNQYDKNVQLHEEITLITRGGSILNYEKDLRISRRGHIYLNEKSPLTGFRLACDK